MSREDPALRRYRRILAALVMAMAVFAAGVGAHLLWRGRGFPAFLALCMVAFLVLLIRGYAKDQEERS